MTTVQSQRLLGRTHKPAEPKEGSFSSASSTEDGGLFCAADGSSIASDESTSSTISFDKNRNKGHFARFINCLMRIFKHAPTITQENAYDKAKKILSNPESLGSRLTSDQKTQFESIKEAAFKGNHKYYMTAEGRKNLRLMVQMWYKVIPEELGEIRKKLSEFGISNKTDQADFLLKTDDSKHNKSLTLAEKSRVLKALDFNLEECFEWFRSNYGLYSDKFPMGQFAEALIDAFKKDENTVDLENFLSKILSVLEEEIKGLPDKKEESYFVEVVNPAGGRSTLVSEDEERIHISHPKNDYRKANAYRIRFSKELYSKIFEGEGFSRTENNNILMSKIKEQFDIIGEPNYQMID